jgi:hypothetical protein
MHESPPHSTFRHVVPRRYWNRTGLDRYVFNIVDPWTYVVNKRLLPDDNVQEIPSCLLYSQWYADGVKHFLLPFQEYSVLCEALLLLARTRRRDRLQRYLTLYKAYELLTDRPDPKYAAIRHAIAHAGSLLTSKETLYALEDALGTRFLNLSRPRDRRVLFCALSEMLMLTDWRLARLLNLAKRRIELDSRDAVIGAMFGPF